jgi:hypothetical protein
MKRLALYYFARAVIALCIAIGVPACGGVPGDCCEQAPTQIQDTTPRPAQVKDSLKTCDGRTFQDLAGNAPDCTEEGATCAFSEAQEYVQLSSPTVFYEFACQEGRWDGWRTRAGQ